MSRPQLNLNITLENIHCFDEGDGPGNAEPYLWPVFFKIDGDSYAVESGSGLIGFPTIFSFNGHHGNLNNTDVDEGDDVPVPESIGNLQNTLKPIPVNDPFLKSLIGDDLPAIAGVAVVLMEQDDWPDNLADTGYQAFVNAVTFAVAKVAAGFQHATSAPASQQIHDAIQTVKDTAATMVHDAVEGAMSGWQKIWYGTFGNNDDEIGSEVWTFTSDDFAADALIDFGTRWKNEGDWAINGTAVGVIPCPANALAGLFGSADNEGLRGAPSSSNGNTSISETLQAMNKFRTTQLSKYPGLENWWRSLIVGNADFIRTLMQDENIKEVSHRLFHAVPSVLVHPDKPVQNSHWNDLAVVIEAVTLRSPLLRRTLGRQALHILPMLKGKTFNEALKHVASLRAPDGKYQRIAGK